MKSILLSVLMMALLITAKAQVPQQLNYQGIARNTYGTPISYQHISVKISLVDSAAGGQVSYMEIRRVMTNYAGLFNIVIGSPGAVTVSGSMQGVNWPTGLKFIKLEIDPKGASNFTLAGITQLQSVPYALSAATSGNAGGDLMGTYPSPRIANNAITNTKIANGSVGMSKLETAVVAALTNKINISDTAAMLYHYATKSAIINSASDKEDVSNKSTDGTFASNSDTKYPSEKATRTYIDALLAAIKSVNGSLSVADTVTAGAFVKAGGTASQFLKADGSVDTHTYLTSAPLITDAADEFTDVGGQTIFYLNHQPSANSKVKMYINGIRITNAAYSVSENVLQYYADNNGFYSLIPTDRIQFDYFY